MYKRKERKAIGKHRARHTDKQREMFTHTCEICLRGEKDITLIGKPERERARQTDKNVHTHKPVMLMK